MWKVAPAAARTPAALVVAGLLASALAAAGCGSSSERTTSTGTSKTTAAAAAAPYRSEVPSSPSPAVAGKTIGIVSLTNSAEFYPRETRAIQQAARTIGWTTKLVDIRGDVTKAPDAIENLLQSGVDGIVLETIVPSLAGDAIAAAKAKHVPLIDTLSGVEASASRGALAATIEQRLVPEATVLGERMITDLGDGAKIATISDKFAPVGAIPSATLRATVKGRLDIVADHQVNYANPVPDAQNAVQAWLTQYPDLKGIWCAYDGPCVGAAQAAQEAGRDVRIYAIDGDPSALDLMRKGVKWVDFATPLEYSGWLTIDTMNSVLAGRPVDPDQHVRDQLTDASNVPAAGVVDGTSLYGPFRETFAKRWKAG